MAEDSFDNFRLSLMQDVLPVGLAMVERARRGGVRKVVSAFTEFSEPLQELRQEGEPAAKSFREQLDLVSPGLGNPVMSVEVEVNNQSSNFEETDDQQSLNHVLHRIECELNILDGYLQSHSEGSSTNVVD